MRRALLAVAAAASALSVGVTHPTQALQPSKPTCIDGGSALCPPPGYEPGSGPGDFQSSGYSKLPGSLGPSQKSPPHVVFRAA